MISETKIERGGIEEGRDMQLRLSLEAKLLRREGKEVLRSSAKSQPESLVAHGVINSPRQRGEHGWLSPCFG